MPLISIARPIIVAAAFGAVLASVGQFASLPSLVGDAGAQQLPASGIKDTKHNFGAGYTDTGSGTRTVVSDPSPPSGPVGPAGGTKDTCVFCHTPHGGTRTGGPVGPLWNRTAAAVASVGSTSYTTYSSSTLQGDGSTDDIGAGAGVQLAQPGDRSKLCLACHDGLLAVNTVANAPGTGGFEATIPTTGLGSGGTLSGTGSDGYTRNIGTDLTNDHPIMVTMSNATASRDTELRSDIDSATASSGRRIYGPYVTGQTKPHLLDPGKVQCPTCHDPHLGNVTVGGVNVNNKFLRLNRFQQGANSKTLSFAVAGSTIAQRNQTPTNNPFTADTDQICIACHTRLGAAWTESAHASSTAAGETYGASLAVTAERNFPAGLPVWRAGCLNCHDTHTKTGAKRLLREGVAAGKPAIEETCYQCHSSASILAANSLTTSDGVPNIGAEFAKTYRMPITDADQGTNVSGNSTEVHSIDDADFTETAANLGAGGGLNAANRHVECTDCHNPHRVVKSNTFLGNQLADGTLKDMNRRTHTPALGTTGNYGNIASGALRGSWGVEPSYTKFGQTTVTTSSIWPENPTFDVKRGDPGGETALPVGTAGTNAASYVTREYQICFKCHSSYANGPNAADFPLLKTTAGRGGTVYNAADFVSNKMSRYTNVAAEFAVRAEDPPVSGLDQGEERVATGAPCVGGDCNPTPSHPGSLGGGQANNHRSWHPVIFPTGRTRGERNMSATGAVNIRPPFDAKIGTQTMHCSDCHGGETSWTAGSGPNLLAVQGPHGSNTKFLLRYNSIPVWGSVSGDGNRLGATADAGFCSNCHFPSATPSSGFNTGHQAVAEMARPFCTMCHIAVPHGWKNKAFLVNGTCVGKEGGRTTDCEDVNSGYGSFTAAPYYVEARARVTNWAQSGSWQESSCGGNKMSGCPEYK